MTGLFTLARTSGATGTCRPQRTVLSARESWLREGSSFDTSVLEETQPDESWPDSEAALSELAEVTLLSASTTSGSRQSRADC